MKAKTPSIVLTDKASTLQFLADHDETHPEKYSIKSAWLCEELNRFEMDGYVYNSAAFDRICAENEISREQAERRKPGTTTRTELGLLGALIYNAQAYRREMKLEAGGWKRATVELLAGLVGKKVMAIANGELTGEREVKVVNFGGRLLLAPPRSRTKAFADYLDWWIKPIAGKPATFNVQLSTVAA